MAPIEVITLDRALLIFQACEEFIETNSKPKNDDLVAFAREIRPYGRLSLVDYALTCAVVYRRLAQEYARINEALTNPAVVANNA